MDSEVQKCLSNWPFLLTEYPTIQCHLPTDPHHCSIVTNNRRTVPNSHHTMQQFTFRLITKGVLAQCLPRHCELTSCVLRPTQPPTFSRTENDLQAAYLVLLLDESLPHSNKNSSGDEIANVNFFLQHRTCRGQRLRPLNEFVISTKHLRYLPTHQTDC